MMHRTWIAPDVRCSQRFPAGYVLAPARIAYAAASANFCRWLRRDAENVFNETLLLYTSNIFYLYFFTKVWHRDSELDISMLNWTSWRWFGHRP